MVIKGIIVRKKYQKSDNSWHVVTFKVKNGTTFEDDISASGYIPWGPDDDVIEMEGDYREGKYGREFVARNSYKEPPKTARGAVKHFEEVVAGFGPSKAKAVLKHFSPGLLSVLEKTPEKLTECPGITPKIAEGMKQAWNEVGLKPKISKFFSEHEINHTWVDKVADKFGVFAVETITNNPYNLTKIRGIGFTKADEIAKKLGFKKDSIERIKACFNHVLTQASEEGHCFLHEGDLKHEVLRLTKAKADKVDEYLEHLIESKHIVRTSLKDDSVNIKVYYLPYLHNAESSVAEHIKSLAGKSKVFIKSRQLSEIQYSDKQREAILSCFEERVTVITGAPGTGKSTTIKGVVELANRNGIDIILCAPTGRAAKRLGEITEEKSSTIHRVLKYDGKENVFRHNSSNHIPNQMIIIDESSMIDIELAEKLLDAIGRDTNVVFIGDTDQLPSVGPGAFLKDLIKSKKVKTIVLDQIFRQAQESLMVQNSHRIKNGEYPMFPPKGTSADSYQATMTGPNQDDAAWAAQVTSQMISVNIPKQMKVLYNIDIDIKKDIQVLIPMKKGSFGVFEANRILQKVFNPTGKPFNAFNKIWHIGDKVIQNNNNYELDVYNGDIGVIKSHDVIDKTITIDYEDKLVTYPYQTANNDLELANAISIHKSQGSEYKVVVVVLLWQHFPMLERNLIYTANTRAKLMTLYVVAGGTIKKAVDTNKVKSRNSLLSHRIRHTDKIIDNPNDDSKTLDNTLDGINEKQPSS